MHALTLLRVLIAIYAFDSISTYIGITHGDLHEWNPVVLSLINRIGLLETMIAIFGWKVLLTTGVYCARWWKPFMSNLALIGLFLFYSLTLGYTWLSLAQRITLW